MAQPPVALRLMQQIELMGKMAATLEAAGKIMSKAEKARIMAVESEKLEALKAEQFALQAPRVLPDEEGEPPTWGAAMAVQPSKKSRADYVDFPCSKYASHPEVFKHCTFSNFGIGREAIRITIRKAILTNTLYLDMHQTKEAMTQRMAKRISGAGVPSNGYLDWEFDDGRGIRCGS